MIDKNFSLKGINNEAQGQEAEPPASAAATLGCDIRRSQFLLGCGGFAATAEEMPILALFYNPGWHFDSLSLVSLTLGFVVARFQRGVRVVIRDSESAPEAKQFLAKKSLTT